ncbi:class IV adenylate cyclase [Candidatus Aerophobetes bacterium]|nr:class IV adenylate cyclase [Candidatus Aerophobetes bacterium]
MIESQKGLEVEVKAKINDRKVEEKLLSSGGIFVSEENQVDTYFQHPCYDLKKKDEALRVRESGGNIYLTFKGPRIDKETKTRCEIEVKVEGDIFSLLEAIGFLPLARIKKKRRTFRWRNLQVCVDRVEKLGSFIEIEGKSFEEKHDIFYLLDILGINRGCLIRKSYLELLCEGKNERKNSWKDRKANC